MAWYNQGSVGVIHDSIVVTGSDTAFKANVHFGDILYIDDELYEIVRVNSDTELELDQPYRGATASGQSFEIIRNLTNSTNYDLIKKMEEFLTDRQRSHDEFVEWSAGEFDGGKQGDGQFPLTDRYGQVTTAPSPKKLTHDSLELQADLQEVIDRGNEYTDEIGDFLPHVAAAEASEHAAKVSETNAKSSETKARSSEINAGTSEANAASSEGASALSEEEARRSELAADQSEANALTYEKSAKTSKDTAYSHKTAAAQAESNAKASENAAAVSETAAYNSELAASGSKSAANTSETKAKTSETNAKSSETAAANSKSAAASSQSSAASSASSANASKIAAQGSADDALASEEASADSESAALVSQNKAKTSETNAKSSEEAAAGSKNAAKTSETNAKSSETAASMSAEEALVSEEAAAASESASASSKSAAKTSETNAKSSETAAASSKSAAAGSQSAARTSETNAANSASAANTSKNAAKTSEANAVASENAAAASEVAAENSEIAAASSEGSAASSASSASSSKSAAKTSETNAASSASSASSSKSAAKTSETNALASKNAAEASETNAASSASSALSSKNAAKTSETNAADSEAAAADSETASAQSETNAASSASSASGSKNAAKTSETNAASSASSASSSKSAAASSASSASSSKSAAKTSETNAASSASAALSSKNTAKTHEDNSAVSASAAKSSETKAKTSETNSKSSETSALSSKNVSASNASDAASSKQQSIAARDLAEEWAEAPEGEEIEPGQYSAKHWAKVAERYGGAAVTALTFRGPWDASKGAPPAPVPETADFYIITVGGTIGGVVYEASDNIVWDTVEDEWFKVDNTDRPISDSLTLDSSVTAASSKAVKSLEDKKLNKSGGTMTGNIQFTDNAEGIDWVRNTDGAWIKFHNTNDGDLNSRLEMHIFDNGNEFFEWTGRYGSTTSRLMTLKPQGSANAGDLEVNRDIEAGRDFVEAGVRLTDKYLGKTANAVSASRWATPRTISLGGDATGSVSVDGTANKTLTVTVKDDSHNHTVANVDGLQTKLDGKLATGAKAVDSDKLDGLNSTQFLRSDISDSMSGNLTVSGLTAGQVETGRIAGSLMPSSNKQVLNHSESGGNSTVYLGNPTNARVNIETENANGFTHYTSEGGTSRVFTDAYHPNADKLTTARTIALGGDLSGSTTFDGTANKTITATVKDNSHNHTSLTGVDIIRFEAHSNDAVSIGTTVDGVSTSLDFNLRDDSGERFRWRYNAWDTPEGDVSVMTLKPRSSSSHIADLTLTGHITADEGFKGNSDTSTKWKTARTVTLSGDLQGSASIDGSANVTLTATVKDDSHNHTVANVDGLQSTLDEKMAKAGFTTGGDAHVGFHAGTNRDASLRLTEDYQNHGAYLKYNGAGDNTTVLGTTNGGVDVDALKISRGSKDVRIQGNGYVNHSQRVFADNYHPNADKLTTARTIALSGDATGSVSFNGTSNVTIPVTIADDSHKHVIANVDGLQSALDGKANNHSHPYLGSSSKAVDSDKLDGLNSSQFLRSDVADVASNIEFGNQNAGLRFAIVSNSSTPGFKTSASHITGGADYAGLGKLNNVAVQTWYGFSVSSTGGGNPVPLGGVAFSVSARSGDAWHFGKAYVDKTQRVFADNYHPNADKWTTARTISLGGDATGSVSFDGSANKTLTVTVKDDSHNHTIANVDGLQSALDGKAATHSHPYLGSSAKAVDSDKLDGLDSSSFLRSNASDTMTGTLTVNGDAILSGSGSQLFVARQQNTTDAPVIDLAIGDRDTGLNWASDGNIQLYANNVITGWYNSAQFTLNKKLVVNSGIQINDNGVNITGDDANYDQDGVNISGTMRVQYDSDSGERSAVHAGVIQAEQAVKAQSYDFHTGDAKQPTRSAGIEFNADTNSIDFVFA